ncbi:ECs_2282 family putative zinc-binding protein [Morganella morganii]|uniref:ECs_2282 family putative zinc-binding protein n=1 Tax=Morganella morganii TaxID=582 RepID=UPI003CC7FF8C
MLIMTIDYDVEFSCPDCGSKSFEFIAEPCISDNIRACASCGRSISKDDVLRDSDNRAADIGAEFLRSALKGD